MQLRVVCADVQSSLLARVLSGGDETFQSQSASPVGSGSPSSRGQSQHGGVTLWPVVSKARTSDGADVNLLVLDIQDFDGADASRSRDECLFALGMLLGSFVVYNTRGGVTEEEIGKLWSHVSAANRSMQITPTNERDQTETEVDLADITPKLLWVLHGFSLSRDDSGRQMTARQYLERALQESDAVLQPGGLAKQSNVKTTLRHIFADRDCFPLVQAACHDASASGLFASPRTPSTAGDTSAGNLVRGEERARAQVSALRDRIMHNAEMKCIGGTPLDGRMLLTVVESFVNALNSGSPLNVGDAWCAVADEACDIVVKRSLADFNASWEALQPQMPLSTCDLSLWQMTSAREAIDGFDALTRHLQGSRVQRHRLRLDETIKALWERFNAANCTAGEDKAQALLAQLYYPVDQRLHADEYSDFAQYDRDRRRVRCDFLDKAPKQAAALAVMYEFMEDEVAKVAKRFVNRVAMKAINCESAKDEEAQALKLEVSNLTLRLESVESALAESKARERKAREELAVRQEEHAQEVLELGEGGSKAMRSLLANCEEAKRGKAEAELQLLHAVETIEELSEWKAMNSSRAIWDAVEARDQQAHEEEEELKQAMQALLQAGETNLRLLTEETQGICRALFAADAPVVPPGEVEMDGWGVLAERSPELASLGQTLAAGQAQLLTRLVAVRAALDGGGSSRCPSCQASEMETAPRSSLAHGAADGVSERERLGERAGKDLPSRHSSVALSPIQLPTHQSEHSCLDGAERGGQAQIATPSMADVVEEHQWFTPAPVRMDQPAGGDETAKLGAGPGAGFKSPLAMGPVTSPAPRPPLAPPLPCPQAARAAAEDAGSAATDSVEGSVHIAGASSNLAIASSPLVPHMRQVQGSDVAAHAPSSARAPEVSVTEEVLQCAAQNDQGAVAQPKRVAASAPGALGKCLSKCVFSEEFVWELTGADTASRGTQSPPLSARSAHAAPPQQQQTRSHAHVADTPARIEHAFRVLQDGGNLPQPKAASTEAASAHASAHVSEHAPRAVELFASAGAAAAVQGAAAQRQRRTSTSPRADALMAARNSEDDRRRTGILARIELLERSISETLSNARGSPAPSITSRATSQWDLVEGVRPHHVVSGCRVTRAAMRVEGMGRR